MSRQDTLHAALERDSRAYQAEWHADVAVRVAFTPANAGRPEKLLGRSLVEARDVDADAHLTARILRANALSDAVWRLPRMVHAS